MNKAVLGLAVFLISSGMATLVCAEQSSTIGTEGIGGTGVKPGDDGFGGTGRAVDMQRPELPERPEFVERPEFERPDNVEIGRDSVLDLDASEALENLPAGTGSD